MKHWLASVILALSAGATEAGAIQTACLTAQRGADGALCACIQAAANRTLSNRDQRLAASFFDDPHRAQEIRQSDRRADERFWDRYQAFGETAQAFCAS